MKKSLGLLFAGTLFSTFNLVLSGYNLMPDWLGYLLFAIGILLLEQDSAGQIGKIGRASCRERVCDLV